jgi:hypothetical protein
MRGKLALAMARWLFSLDAFTRFLRALEKINNIASYKHIGVQD